MIPISWHGYCKHVPTCSNYAIEAIETYGVLKGIKLGCKRILKCRPGGIYGYQPLVKDVEK